MIVRPHRALVGSLLLSLLAAGCGSASSTPASDEARRDRIDALWNDLRDDVPDVPSVDPSDLLTGDRATSVVLVDVRTAEERAVSMIPGAITAEELEADGERYRGREIVAYCTIGYRSAFYADQLRREGWNASNMAGSILAWTHEGGPLVGPEGSPTRRIHVYGEDWNLAPAAFDPVW